MNEWIDRFLTHLEVEKELAPRTIAEYGLNLRLLLSFLTERKGIQRWDEVTYDHVRAFLHYLAEERNNSARARAMKVSTMRTFFKYMYLENAISIPLAERLIKPKFEQNIPSYLSKEECLRFITIIRNNSRHAVRDSTIILTFLYTGIRLSELCRLNMDDLDFEQETIRVMGKGRKERLVPMSHPLKEVLRRYLHVRQERLGVEHERVRPLFVSRRYQRWNRINRRTVHDLFNHYAAQAKIDKQHFSAHKLRHSFATMLYASGVELIELQQLLGHSSLHTTQIYTHTSTEQLKTAIDKHPFQL